MFFKNFRPAAPWNDAQKLIFHNFDGPVGTLNESYESTESSDVIGQSIQARGDALETI